VTFDIVDYIHTYMFSMTTHIAMAGTSEAVCDTFQEVKILKGKGKFVPVLNEVPHHEDASLA
jgi:hypothetical protein